MIDSGKALGGGGGGGKTVRALVSLDSVKEPSLDSFAVLSARSDLSGECPFSSPSRRFYHPSSLSRTHAHTHTHAHSRA
jgi:hypothetical protein